MVKWIMRSTNKINISSFLSSLIADDVLYRSMPDPIWDQFHLKQTPLKSTGL